MKFEFLVNTIQQTHEGFQKQAAKAINISITLRNWMIGFYILEFEQQGEDRAKYGEALLQNIAQSVNQPSLSYRNLKLFRQFYQEYTQIWQSLPAQFKMMDFEISTRIGQTASAQLLFSGKEEKEISVISASSPKAAISLSRLF